MANGEWLGGVMRGLLATGAGAHLMAWAKRRDGRTINTALFYIDGAPAWRLTVTDETGDTRYECDKPKPSLEQCVLEAVAALGIAGRT